MDIKTFDHIHFTGIKGVGMTALALCFQDLGVEITGSDTSEVFVTDETLKRRGISWSVGFNEKNLAQSRPDLVITTGAHGGLNNPEVVAAKDMGIPVMTQGEALAELTKGKETIVVCGVGGKSTTTAMIATIFDSAGLHPSFAVGVGNIPSLGAPGRYDKEGKVFVAEGDEYAVSPGVDNRAKFLLFTPRVVVVTNIEHDHPDIYPTIRETKKAFREFFQKVPKDGLLLVNENNQNTIDLVKNLNVPHKTYTFLPEDIKLNVPGKFNRANADSALKVCQFYEIPEDIIKVGLAKFTGTRRRFEKMGERNGILFYDDYAHTPNEIKATLAAARESFSDKRLIAIFQAHTYSRTKALLEGFAQSFAGADKVGIMEIYASARETDNLGMSGKLLAKEVSKFHKDVSFTGNVENTIKWIKDNTKTGDVVLTLGAGDIFKIYEKFGV